MTDATFTQYMRAAILAQNPVHIDAWNEAAVRSVFHLLPTPQVPFEIWHERMQAQSLSTPEQLDANDRFIAFARDLPDILHLE